MKVKELATTLKSTIDNDEIALDKDIHGVYCGDLLSWVMGNGEPGNAWITVQGHINTIAVATLREFSCIILAEGAQANEDMLAKAKSEHLAVLNSDLTVYQIAKEMVGLGL